MSNDNKKNVEINSIETIEIESPLEFENWMVNDTVWSTKQMHEKHFRMHHRKMHEKHYNHERPLKLEDWMLDSDLFCK